MLPHTYYKQYSSLSALFWAQSQKSTCQSQKDIFILRANVYLQTHQETMSSINLTESPSWVAEARR